MKDNILDYTSKLIENGWDIKTCYLEEKYARFDIS